MNATAQAALLFLAAHAAPAAILALLSALGMSFVYIGHVLMQLKVSKARHVALAVAAAAKVGYHEVRDQLTKDVEGKSTLGKADFDVLKQDAVRAGLHFIGEEAANDIKEMYGHTDEELAGYLGGTIVTIAGNKTVTVLPDGVKVVAPGKELGQVRANLAFMLAGCFLMIWGFGIACTKAQEQLAVAQAEADAKALAECAVPALLPVVIGVLEGGKADYQGDLVSLEQKCAKPVVQAVVTNATAQYEASLAAKNPPNPAQAQALVRAHAYLGR